MVMTLHGPLVVVLLVLGWPGWPRGGAGTGGGPGHRLWTGAAGVDATSTDAAKNTVLCPYANVSCNVSLIVGGNIGDTVDVSLFDPKSSFLPKLAYLLGTTLPSRVPAPVSPSPASQMSA